MSASSGWLKTRRRLVGVVFLAVISLLVWVSVSLYQQKFTPVVLVTLDTDTVGNELHPQAQVMVRGVVVGEVRQITANGSGAQLQLALQPDKVPLLPANVTAQLLPTTLFGERYVDLVLPASPVPQRLTQGSVIGEDRSSSAIELQKVLADLMPMLQAVQPQKLSVTLTAISQAVQGRGTELGQTLVRINSYLQDFNPNLSALDNDINELVAVANTYTAAAPDIVAALSNLTTTSRTLVAESTALTGLYQTVTSSAQTLTQFLQQNQAVLIQLTQESLPILQLLEKYAPEFPCLLDDLNRMQPLVNKALGAGTTEPGLHVTATVRPAVGPYLPGVDKPAFTDTGGPKCYPVGGGGVVLDGNSLANTPAENEFVTELAGSSLGVAPATLPGWSSVLVGPLYRGTEVTLK